MRFGYVHHFWWLAAFCFNQPMGARPALTGNSLERPASRPRESWHRHQGKLHQQQSSYCQLVLKINSEIKIFLWSSQAWGICRFIRYLVWFHSVSWSNNNTTDKRILTIQGWLFILKNNLNNFICLIKILNSMFQGSKYLLYVCCMLKVLFKQCNVIRMRHVVIIWYNKLANNGLHQF